MSEERLLLSEKYKAFLRCDAPVEFLEGTTAAGKTTVGLFKFMLKVAESPKKLHILAADDTGAAEKNIINKDLGILDDFGVLVEYRGNGSGEYKMPHLLFHTSGGDKIIFVVGYGNKRKWKDALGGQYGCLYICLLYTSEYPAASSGVFEIQQIPAAGDAEHDAGAGRAGHGGYDGKGDPEAEESGAGEIRTGCGGG